MPLTVVDVAAPATAAAVVVGFFFTALRCAGENEFWRFTLCFAVKCISSLALGFRTKDASGLVIVNKNSAKKISSANSLLLLSLFFFFFFRFSFWWCFFRSLLLSQHTYTIQPKWMSCIELKKRNGKTKKETRCTRTKEPLDEKEKHLYAVFNPLTPSAHYITYHHVRHNAINCLSLSFCVAHVFRRNMHFVSHAHTRIPTECEFAR